MMSKQVSVSAAFSVFAMSAFVVFSGGPSLPNHDYSIAGTSTFADAPAYEGLSIAAPFALD